MLGPGVILPRLSDPSEGCADVLPPPITIGIFTAWTSSRFSPTTVMHINNKKQLMYNFCTTIIYSFGNYLIFQYI